MKMDDIDISGNTSNLIDEYMSIRFDFIITVCNHANETCPFIPSKNAIRIHQNFNDPSTVKIDYEDEKIKNYINCLRCIQTILKFKLILQIVNKSILKTLSVH